MKWVVWDILPNTNIETHEIEMGNKKSKNFKLKTKNCKNQKNTPNISKIEYFEIFWMKIIFRNFFSENIYLQGMGGFGI